MTYREFAQKDQPDLVSDLYVGGVCSCPSDILNGAKGLCGGVHDGGNEEKCRMCWDQEIPDQSAKADSGGTMITLKLERADIENLIEFFDLAFFDHLKNLLEADELDNMKYLASMLRVYDELNRAKDAEEEA